MDAPPGCGNGVVESPEECDDGDLSPGDGCDSACRVETGWACSGQPSSCDTVCGDGIVAVGREDCDDGNTVSGDGCSMVCRFECSNTSGSDCNWSGSTKNAAAAFVDPDPPAGYVQCAGFINTAQDDVNRHWESHCLGAVRSLRIRYWDVSSQPWTLLGDAELEQDSLATFASQTFDASQIGGTEGVKSDQGVVLLKDPPTAGPSDTSVFDCQLGTPDTNIAANDLYLANASNTKALYVCSGDDNIDGNPCTPDREIMFVEASMLTCDGLASVTTDLAVAVYYAIQ